MAFKKGQSGNPGGRSKERIWRNAIERAIERAAKEGMQVVDELAEALVKKAKDGDVNALKEIGDRLDGKPTTTVEAGPQLAKLLIGWAE